MLQYTQAQLSFAGGSDKSTYYIGGGYTNNEGAYLASGFKRYNFRSNLTLAGKALVESRPQPQWRQHFAGLSYLLPIQNKPTWYCLVAPSPASIPFTNAMPMAAISSMPMGNSNLTMALTGPTPHCHAIT